MLVWLILGTNDKGLRPGWMEDRSRKELDKPGPSPVSAYQPLSSWESKRELVSGGASWIQLCLLTLQIILNAGACKL